MHYDIAQLNHLFRHRRSIYPRDYTGEPVPDSVIEQMLENANWAPTHKLTEPWRFTVFTGTGLHALATFQSECYRQVTTANQTFQQDRFDALRTKPLESSHIIAIGMKRDPKKSVPAWEELGAVFCAIQNMMLTAAACGVGSYLSTGGITSFAEAKPFFDLGEEDQLCGFLHVGMPKGPVNDSRRRPVQDKTTWRR